MKIVLFDINRLSFEGGAEKYLSEVGIIFNKKGNEVYFVGYCRPIMKLFIWSSVFLFINPFWKLPKYFTQLKESSPLKKNSDNFITHIPLKLFSLFPFSSEKKKLKNFLEEADLILIKNEIAEMIFFWLLNIKNENKHLMIFSSLEYPFAESFRSKIHNFIYLSKFYKFLIKKIGKVIISNQEDEKYFIETIKIDKRNLNFIPYGLNENYFAKPNEIKSVNGFKILFVGRMEEQKGIIYLKQIIENINKDKKLKNVSFTIVGGGPLEEIPRELSKKYHNVEYKGQLSLEEVRKCYLESDLVIITSKWETFSYVCLEAQACGVPVIAFDIPGPRDIISEETGRLTPLSDILEFQKNIYCYYNDKKKRPEDYFKKRKLISDSTFSKFSISSTCKHLETVVLSGKSS